MTLITYLTRVHFADGVLEEALWSEIKAFEKKRPLIIAEEKQEDNEISERFFSGLPIRTKPVVYSDIPNIPTEAAANEIAELYFSNQCDVLVAFGTAAAIDLAKVAKVAITHPDTGLANFSHARGGSKRIGEKLPDLIVAPGISGVGASVSAHAPVILRSGERVLLMCKKLIPAVTICDPTITLAATTEQSASAGADAITRCIEAYLSKSYNPPAEGIALDGLNRAVGHLQLVIDDGQDIDGRRELMAASLNGALALQKGLGASHAISSALEAVTDAPLDHGSLSRITLPSVLRYNENSVGNKYEVLKRVFPDFDTERFPQTIEGYFGKLPLAKSLSELGLGEENLKEAASIASRELASVTNPRDLNAKDYFSIMQSVY